jgi:MFS family permease
VANVALPDIGKAFDAGQTSLNLVAVGYSLGLAASVLYLGALGDRYGRKLMLILGTALADPVPAVAALAPSIEVLFARGSSAGSRRGMAYPTTLALITALWSGPARTKSIALWSALGGAIAALGPLLSGALLTGSTGAPCSSSRCRSRSSPSSSRSATCPLTSTRPRTRRQPRRHPVGAARARWCSPSTSRRCQTRGRSGWAMP